MKIYLAGPVSEFGAINGVASEFAINQARTKFAIQEHALKKIFPEIVNPLKLTIPSDATRQEALKICIPALLPCDGIFLMKGWQQSEGSLSELAIALMLNKDVYFEVLNDKYDLPTMQVKVKNLFKR